MGCCFFFSSSKETDSSSSSSSSTASTAKVISVNGTLGEYPVPVSVSQVLGLESPNASSVFLCNSDSLYFDDYIPPLHPKEELEVGQIYFVLPITRLQYPLTAREMAALAVKASVALVDGGLSRKKGRRRRSRKMQISQVFDVSHGGFEMEDSDDHSHKRLIKKVGGNGVGQIRSRSVGTVMKTPRRAKIAYRSFRARLSTIPEGSVAE